MKTLYFNSIITTLFSLFLSFSLFASGLHFSVKVNTVAPLETNKELKSYTILKQTKEYFITGSFSQYIEAMKAKQEIQSNGYTSIEIVAFFNHSLISIEDAFALMDNRNQQDEENKGFSLTEEELSNLLVQVQDQEFFYTVQMGLFTEKNINDFFDFPKQYDERISTKGSLRYTYGTFATLSDAKDALKMVQEYGLNEAFVIAFDNLERIPLSRAIEKEKEAINNLITINN
jgi:hypothetical protein